MERSIWIVTSCPFVPLLINDTLNKLEAQVYIARWHHRGTCAALSWKPNIWAQCVLRMPPCARCQVPGALCQVSGGCPQVPGHRWHAPLGWDRKKTFWEFCCRGLKMDQTGPKIEENGLNIVFLHPYKKYVFFAESLLDKLLLPRK